MQVHSGAALIDRHKHTHADFALTGAPVDADFFITATFINGKIIESETAPRYIRRNSSAIMIGLA